jgi:nitroreductase
MSTEVKIADPDHPVHELIVRRWSPYVFDPRPVPAEDLRSLFEAARWSPSSFNEQPWRFIVATSDEPAEHQRLLGCLIEKNQNWARHAPVLVIAAVSTTFARNDAPNRTALHDLGLAVANLSFEATARGLVVHQMAGILPDRARELYDIPEHCEAVTALAIGHPGDPQSAPAELRDRDSQPRNRKPLREYVFSGNWEALPSWLE